MCVNRVPMCIARGHNLRPQSMRPSVQTVLALMRGGFERHNNFNPKSYGLIRPRNLIGLCQVPVITAKRAVILRSGAALILVRLYSDISKARS